MPRITLPTSQGGLNLRDSLDNMPYRDCIQLDNVIPDVESDKVRKGYTEISTYPANRIINFENTMLACQTNEISLINTTTGADTLLKNGFFSSDWKYTNFQTAGGNSLVIMANGVDTVQSYDGTTLQDVGYTGTDLTNLESPLTFKNRTYFVERHSLSIWYSDTQAIAGDLTEFSIRGFARRGGTILTIENWSQDAGEGLTNLLAIFTTEGEVLIYGGDDPEASNWALKGVFEISKPIGKRCCRNYGSDIIVVTENGYLPLASVLSQDKANISLVSDKINNIVKNKSKTANWSIHWYSEEGWLFINAPSTTIFNYEQHVLNVETNAWCRFVGYDALDWLVIEDKLYYCNSNGIYRANNGTTDNGEPITYVKQQAYSKFNGEKVKGVQRVKVRYNTEGVIEYTTRIGVDFDLGAGGYTMTTGDTGITTLWDEAIWDESFWSDEQVVKSFKGTVFSKKGEYISIGYFGNSDNGLNFYSSDILYSAGNGDI